MFGSGERKDGTLTNNLRRNRPFGLQIFYHVTVVPEVTNDTLLPAPMGIDAVGYVIIMSSYSSDVSNNFARSGRVLMIMVLENIKPRSWATANC